MQQPPVGDSSSASDETRDPEQKPKWQLRSTTGTGAYGFTKDQTTAHEYDRPDSGTGLSVQDWLRTCAREHFTSLAEHQPWGFNDGDPETDHAQSRFIEVLPADQRLPSKEIDTARISKLTLCSIYGPGYWIMQASMDLKDSQATPVVWRCGSIVGGEPEALPRG